MKKLEESQAEEEYQKNANGFHDHGKIVLKVHKIVPRGGVFVYLFYPGAVISQKFSAQGQECDYLKKIRRGSAQGGDVGAWN